VLQLAETPGSRSKFRPGQLHVRLETGQKSRPHLLNLARGWALSLQRHGAAAVAAAQPVRLGAPSAPSAAAAAAAARLHARRARPELYAAAECRQVGARSLLPAAARGCAGVTGARGRRRRLRRARGLHLRGTLRCPWT